jgi:anti-sigma B factor antagonist
MSTLAAQIERTGNRAVATFSTHEVTTIQMQEVVVELMEMMRNDAVQYFVMDMNEVEFISSGCLGSLVEFIQDLGHMRGKLALARCHDNVAFLFKVTRLDSIFPMFDEVEEAMTAMTSP